MEGLGFELPPRQPVGRVTDVPAQAARPANLTGQEYPVGPEAAADIGTEGSRSVTHDMEQNGRAAVPGAYAVHAEVGTDPVTADVLVTDPTDNAAAPPYQREVIPEGLWRQADATPLQTDVPLEPEPVMHVPPAESLQDEPKTYVYAIRESSAATASADTETKREAPVRTPVPPGKPSPWPRDKDNPRVRPEANGNTGSGLKFNLPPRDGVPRPGSEPPSEGAEATDHTHQRPPQPRPDREPSRTGAELVHVPADKIDGVLRHALNHEGRMPGNVDMADVDGVTVARAVDIVRANHPQHGLSHEQERLLEQEMRHRAGDTSQALARAVTGSALLVAAEHARHLPSVGGRLPQGHDKRDAIHLGWQLVEVVNDRFGDPRQVDPRSNARAYTRPGREMAPLVYVQALEAAGPLHRDIKVAALVGFKESRDAIGRGRQLPSGFAGYPQEIEVLKARVDQIVDWAQHTAAEKTRTPDDQQDMEVRLLTKGLEIVANEHLDARQRVTSAKQAVEAAELARDNERTLAQHRRELANQEALDAHVSVALSSTDDIINDDYLALDPESPQPRPDVDKLTETRAALLELADAGDADAAEELEIAKASVEGLIINHYVGLEGDIREGRIDAALAIILDHIEPDAFVDKRLPKDGSERYAQEETARNARRLQNALTDLAYKEMTPDHTATIEIKRGDDKVTIPLRERFGRRHPQVPRVVRTAFVTRMVVRGLDNRKAALGEGSILTREAETRMDTLRATRMARLNGEVNRLTDDEARMLPRPVVEFITGRTRKSGDDESAGPSRGERLGTWWGGVRERGPKWLRYR